MMIKNYKKIITAILISLMWISFAVAADKLPEIMVGQTIVTQYPGGDGVNYYGGYTGNEVVYNSNASGKTTGKSLAPSAVFNGLRNITGVPATTNNTNPTPNYSKVDCGTGSAITGEGPFSVSVWVKRDRTEAAPKDPDTWDYDAHAPVNPRDFIISQGSGMYGDYYIFFNKFDQVTLRTFGYGSDHSGGWSGIDLTSGAKTIPYTDKNWHHIVAVRNNDGMTGSLWVDGQDVTTYVCPGTVCTEGQRHVQLGGGQVMGSDYYRTVIGAMSWIVNPGGNRPWPFKGNISSVRTYDRALIPTEIASLHNETNITSLATGLKAYWKLNDGSGTSIADYSGNNNTCTASNAAWADDGPLIAGTNSDDLFGFNKDLLVTCAQSGMLANPDRCFRRNTSGAGSVTVMNSRTSINGTAVTETAALFYPPKTVVGDVYGSMDNFAFWGRNLHQNGNASSDASWKTGAYTLNSAAQSAWNGTEFAKNTAKIAALNGEASAVNPDIGSTRTSWYLQTPTAPAPATSTMISGNTVAEVSKYPEGKVWVVNGNLIINASATFYGKGTIIVNGNLTINSGVSISPAPTGENRLGFIVLGTNGTNGIVTISGNNKIQSSIYCPGTITVSALNKNVELTGSFVARSFNITAANTRFFYDYALDSAWPPGFRFLNMPHPNEASQ